MIATALAVKDCALFNDGGAGEQCDCCGHIERLGSFKMEAVFDGAKVVHKARLCNECMLSAEQVVSFFLEKSHVH